MKLYLVTRNDHLIPDTDKCAGLHISAASQWAGTQADARSIRIAFEEPLKEIKAAKRPKVIVDEIDVPTDKQGLLKFLNANAV
jgi:hypothetical protein